MPKITFSSRKLTMKKKKIRLKRKPKGQSIFHCQEGDLSSYDYVPEFDF